MGTLKLKGCLLWWRRWEHKRRVCEWSATKFKWLWNYLCKGLITSLWKWKLLSGVWLFATSWIIQSMEFSRPEYWSGKPLPLQGIFPTQGSNPGFPHCRRIFFYQLSHKGSPRILDWVAYPFSSRSSWPRYRTMVSYIAGRFFTTWATREALSSNRVQHPQV